MLDILSYNSLTQAIVPRWCLWVFPLVSAGLVFAAGGVGYWTRDRAAKRESEAYGAHLGNVCCELADSKDGFAAVREQCEILARHRNSLIHNVELLRKERAEMQERLDKFAPKPRDERGLFLKSSR